MFVLLRNNQTKSNKTQKKQTKKHLFYLFVKPSIQTKPNQTFSTNNSKATASKRIKPRNSVHLYELTVPQESRIDEANRHKSNKYSHFLTDILNRNVSLHPFEIGSVTGHISERNKITLKSLHKFVKQEIPLKSFISNISAIAILCSHFIFNARKQREWQSPGYVGPPLKMKSRNIGAN